MEIIIAFVAFIICFLAMMVGVLFRNRPLKGSCGGMAAMMGSKECEMCGGSPQQCEEERRLQMQADQKSA